VRGKKLLAFGHRPIDFRKAEYSYRGRTESKIFGTVFCICL